MGVQYYVACRKCRVYRDLDKFYAMLTDVPDRAAAIAFCPEIEKQSFRAGLLVSFMWAHHGHDCLVCDEHEDWLFDEFQPEPVNYWERPEGEPPHPTSRKLLETCFSFLSGLCGAGALDRNPEHDALRERANEIYVTLLQNGCGLK